MLDGAKALVAAVKAVFDHPVVQRCQLHKVRNVESKLPKNLGQMVLRWCAAGMIEASKQFRRVNGFLRASPRRSRPGRCHTHMR